MECLSPEFTHRVIAVRHGRCGTNEDTATIGGRTNKSPLTVTGVEQSKRLGAFFREREIKFAGIYVSPAVRTQRTAYYMLTAMGLAPVFETCDALQELDQGKMTGRKRLEVYTPEVLSEITRQGKNFKFDEGESMGEVGARGLGVLAMIGEQEPSDDPYLIVGHGIAIRTMVGEVEGWPHQRIYDESTGNASYTMLTNWVDQGWRLNYLGRQASPEALVF